MILRALSKKNPVLIFINFSKDCDLQKILNENFSFSIFLDEAMSVIIINNFDVYYHSSF